MPMIYVACLASYNNGVLHGEWIDLDGIDRYDLDAAIAAMLRTSPYPNTVVEWEGQPTPSAEEWAIHDTDDFEGIQIGEYADLDTVLNHAAMLSEHGAAWAAYCKCVGDNYATAEGFTDAYQGEYNTKEDFAYYLVDESGLLRNIHDNVSRYFDYDAYARDLFLDGYSFVRLNGQGYVFADC